MYILLYVILWLFIATHGSGTVDPPTLPPNMAKKLNTPKGGGEWGVEFVLCTGPKTLGEVTPL